MKGRFEFSLEWGECDLCGTQVKIECFRQKFEELGAVHVDHRNSFYSYQCCGTTVEWFKGKNQRRKAVKKIREEWVSNTYPSWESTFFGTGFKIWKKA